MKKNYSPVILLFIYLLYGHSPVAQDNTPYAYQHLSAFAFQKQKDSLKKNWDCPELYSNKKTQARFKESWDSRTEFITGAMEANDFIRDEVIYTYVNQLVTDIARANAPLLPQTPLLLVDRSAAVNAYSVGNHVIIINLGMLSFAQSREEIALAIAHEMAHDLLKHTENALKESAELLTSDVYKRSLESVLDSRYGRFTRLTAILSNFAFSRSRHNRYHENEADSLAIVLLKNSGIPFNPVYFLRLDSADHVYKQELQKEVKQYFLPYQLALDDGWFVKKTKGLSNKRYSYTDSTGLNDSLKTHPDCRARYIKTLPQGSPNPSFTPVPTVVREKINKALTWNLFTNMDLTACLYRVLLEKDKGNTDPWYDFMVHNILNGLCYSSMQLNRFNAIRIKPKEYISNSYATLQNLLEQVPLENLKALSREMGDKEFWSRLPADAVALQQFIRVLNSEEGKPGKKEKNAASAFTGTNPASMYCEFADYFKKN